MRFRSMKAGWATRLGTSHMYDATCGRGRAGGGEGRGESLSQLAQHWKIPMQNSEELEKFKFE